MKIVTKNICYKFENFRWFSGYKFNIGISSLSSKIRIYLTILQFECIIVTENTREKENKKFIFFKFGGYQMEKPLTLSEGVDSWNTIIFLYNSALKEVKTKVEILNDEFQQVHQYNPIEYVKARIKTPESIVKKLRRNGYESSIDNMVNHVNDIAGIRIVCSFTSDIYKLAEMIGKQNDLTVVSVKDYIKNPKESGYESFHMLVTVPIFMSDRVVDTKVEIQIRTMAMDFWASLEHKIYYKFEGHAPDYISRDLQECSDIVSMLDAKMLQLNEAILEAKAAQEDDTGAV